jgi:hypothetical protein
MFISLVGHQAESICADLEAAGIAFVRHPPVAGDIRKNGQTVEVFAQSLPVVETVASVLTSWVRAKLSRKAIITSKHYYAFDVEKLCSDEISHLLVMGRGLTVFDTCANGPQSPAKQISRPAALTE